MNKKSKKVWYILLVIGILSTPVSVMAANMEVDNSTVEISPRKDKFEWRYKIFDGLMYKRLYNIKTGQYITDWILMGEYI